MLPVGFQNLREKIKKFHNNEDGMEAIQVVIIIAIAAVVLMAVKLMWPQIESFFKTSVSKILSWG